MGCNDCYSLEVCERCDSNFELNNGSCICSGQNLFLINNVCSLCSISNCEVCSSLQQCEKCEKGFILRNGECLGNESAIEEESLGLIINLSVLGVVIIAVIIITTIYKFYHRPTTEAEDIDDPTEKEIES